MTRTPVILLVEDDDADATLVAEGLRETGHEIELLRAADGGAALAMLEDAATGVAQRPDLVILDLNLPGLSGVEVLEHIKRDSRLRDTPVTVLSTSADPRDIERVYAANGNAYVTKPMDLTGFLAAVDQIHRFWVDMVSVPWRETT